MGSSGCVNCNFANINNPNSTTISFTVAEHAIPKLMERMNGVLVYVPFTMQGNIAVFGNFTPAQNPTHNVLISGSGTALVYYTRTQQSVKAFRNLPNPDLRLSYVSFRFENAALAK